MFWWEINPRRSEFGHAHILEDCVHTKIVFHIQILLSSRPLLIVEWVFLLQNFGQNFILAFITRIEFGTFPLGNRDTSMTMSPIQKPWKNLIPVYPSTRKGRNNKQNFLGLAFSSGNPFGPDSFIELTSRSS